MSNIFVWFSLSWIAVTLFIGDATAAFQDSNSAVKRAAASDGATIRGKIIAAEASPVDVDLATIPIVITEQIAYKPLPLPPDWGTRTDEQREAWIKEFQETDAGKEFFTKREEQFKNQRRFDLKLEPDGSFEIYDVPPANYNLFGRKDVEANGKKYAVEVFGVFELTEVDELAMEPLPATVTRLLSAGEESPEISVESLTVAGEKITLAQFRGRPVLICFWTMNNAGVETDVPLLKKVHADLGAELKLEMLAVCVDEESDKAAEFVRAQELNWPQGKTGGWKHETFVDYGLRSVPAYFLIGADGKLLMSNAEFFREFSMSTRDLTAIVRDEVTGVTKSDDK